MMRIETKIKWTLEFGIQEKLKEKGGNTKRKETRYSNYLKKIKAVNIPQCHALTG